MKYKLNIMSKYNSILFIFLLYGVSAEILNAQIVNKNVERTIDLTSQLVKITTTITFENTGKDAIRNYLVVLEPDTEGNLSYIGIRDILKEELIVIPTKIEGHDHKEFYSVNFKQPLASGRTMTITLEMVLTGSLVPYPNMITQKEKQFVRYFGSHYFYSPYQTSKQTTQMTLRSRSIENYSKLKPVAQSDNVITYGPYNNIKEFTLDTLMVHYENNSPFITVTRLERLIEVSHWGNIAVEENIEIWHTGAKLKGPFSRYDYQRDTTSNQHSVKAYHTALPAAAHNIYYRDSNGNISTSQVRVRKDWIELELKPRFPLFGGWRSSYTLGYSVPSYQYLSSSGNEYVLNMRLLDHVFDDMHVEELETSIVLPVGVSHVKVTTPYQVKRFQDGVTHKYLDSMGRLVIKLSKKNLVENHIQDLEIRYNWQSVWLVHEPLLITTVLYILFLIVIIYVRLDFSINKPEHAKKE